MLWSESRKGSNWVEIKIIRIKNKKEKKTLAHFNFFYVKNTFYSKEADVNQSLKKESSLALDDPLLCALPGEPAWRGRGEEGGGVAVAVTRYRPAAAAGTAEQMLP